VPLNGREIFRPFQTVSVKMLGLKLVLVNMRLITIQFIIRDAQLSQILAVGLYVVNRPINKSQCHQSITNGAMYHVPGVGKELANRVMSDGDISNIISSMV